MGQSTLEWKQTTVQPALEPGQVHLWRVELNKFRQNVPKLRLDLADQESSRADRFLHRKDAENYIVARSILRQLLGNYLGRKPGEIAIETGKFGKPYVAKHMNSKELKFNISHSGELCLIAARWESEIGIDLEKIRDDVLVEDLANRYFAPEEIAELQALPDAQRRLGFFLCWTRKEAYVKAKSGGLHIPLHQFAVTLTPGAPAKLRSDDSGHWSMESLEPAPEYVGAVVTSRTTTGVSYCYYAA
jgi:4'-phosphopantetheinyl transferase